MLALGRAASASETTVPQSRFAAPLAFRCRVNMDGGVCHHPCPDLFLRRFGLFVVKLVGWGASPCGGTVISPRTWRAQGGTLSTAATVILTRSVDAICVCVFLFSLSAQGQRPGFQDGIRLWGAVNRLRAAPSPDVPRQNSGFEVPVLEPRAKRGQNIPLPSSASHFSRLTGGWEPFDAQIDLSLIPHPASATANLVKL